MRVKQFIECLTGEANLKHQRVILALPLLPATAKTSKFALSSFLVFCIVGMSAGVAIVPAWAILALNGLPIDDQHVMRVMTFAVNFGLNAVPYAIGRKLGAIEQVHDFRLWFLCRSFEHLVYSF